MRIYACPTLSYLYPSHLIFGEGGPLVLGWPICFVFRLYPRGGGLVIILLVCASLLFLERDRDALFVICATRGPLVAPYLMVWFTFFTLPPFLF